MVDGGGAGGGGRGGTLATAIFLDNLADSATQSDTWE
jgi:hypothetical protein